MKVRAIDINGDWMYGKSINDYKQNNNAIAQLINTRLKSFIGDCFFAIDEGLDWWNLLGSKNQVALNLAVSATIIKTEGVSSLKQLSIVLNSLRNITISYEVDTIYTGVNNTGTVASTSGYILTEAGDVLVTESGDGLTG